MITKAKLIETIDEFPETFSIDELIEKAILIDKIERGDEQSKNGETITETELEKEMQRFKLYL
jgi:hypothetical protein